MSPRKAVATAVLIALAVPAGAEAGPPGKWTQVSGPHRNTHEPGLARTGDGVLHVLWTREQGTAGTVLHSSVAANAKAVSPNGVNTSVQLLAAPGGGLRALFGGLAPDSPLDQGMATATSADGKAWSLQPTLASESAPSGAASKVYTASGIGGAIGKDGTVFSSWGDSGFGEGGWHVGLSPATPDLRFGATDCCVYDPNIGVDAVTGAVVAAWKRIGNGTTPDGTFAQSIAPAGGRFSSPNANAADTGNHTGITGRIGAPGVFVAYQSGSNKFLSRPALWRFGAPKAKLLSKQRGARMIGISRAPKGRLWVFWMRENRVVATRSNPQATVFGAAVTARMPKGGRTIHGLAGEGSRGPLDVVALVERGGGQIDNWHQRLLPGLTLKAKGAKGKAVFTVRDAGAKLAGVKVVAGGKATKTKPSGGAALKLAPGRYLAKATRKGYAPATVRVRVK
jgi:hypothetical protein